MGPLPRLLSPPPSALKAGALPLWPGGQIGSLPEPREKTSDREVDRAESAKQGPSGIHTQGG